jgi:hypothetical protein
MADVEAAPAAREEEEEEPNAVTAAGDVSLKTLFQQGGDKIATHRCGLPLRAPWPRRGGAGPRARPRAGP